MARWPYIICDADGIIRDISTHEQNLSAGLPFLEADGVLYSPEQVGAVEWPDWPPWVGDHFDGQTHLPDSPKRAEAEAYQQETRRLQAAVNALAEVQPALEAQVGALTIEDIEKWADGISYVAAASTAADFMQRWLRYERKRTLFEIELIRLLRRALGMQE